MRLRDQLRFDRHAFGHAQTEHQRFTRSPPKMRIKSSSSDRKNREDPGSPWRPARPRNWLSMRRASCRSVPRMCRPPSATTSSCSALHCSANCVVHRLPLFLRHLENFPFVLEQHHRAATGCGCVCPLLSAPITARRRAHTASPFVLQEMLARHRFRIAAQQNVRAAAGHVRRHGHRAFASRLRDDSRFALVLLGVQHLVRNACLLQNVRDRLGLFDGNRSHQHRLSALVNWRIPFASVLSSCRMPFTTASNFSSSVR